MNKDRKNLIATSTDGIHRNVFLKILTYIQSYAKGDCHFLIAETIAIYIYNTDNYLNILSFLYLIKYHATVKRMR